MVRRSIKRAILTLCWGLGAFVIARRITRHKLRILCYHGFSVGDQHDFSPFLFMRPETFARHIDVIVRMGCPVVSLEDGLALLENGGVRRGETVITIDDGWKTTQVATQLLRAAALPATVYVTSYYVGKPVAVFNVALRYLFWKRNGSSIDVRGVHPLMDGKLDLSQPTEPTIERWIRIADEQLEWPERQRLLERIARAFDLDPAEVFAADRFTLLDDREVAEMSAAGIDIQLHAHRHRLPAHDFAEAQREIDENRAALEAITHKPADHFCYPSGLYASIHPTWLERLGVASATTCEPGLNAVGANRYLLRRHLLRDDAPDIELIAELSGFTEILRSLRERLKAFVGTNTSTSTSPAQPGI
jgi:peptidoglycan/xylan/chitin deacetylase (PgdA/CDA1 family)